MTQRLYLPQNKEGRSGVSVCVKNELRRNSTAEIIGEIKLSGTNRNREASTFPFQLSTKRISNHTMLMPSILKVKIK